MKRLFPLVFICLGAAAQGQDIAADSLVLHLPFNGNATDISGNGYNGVVKGATLTTGAGNEANAAYYFDGLQSTITIPNIEKLDGPLTAFTILVRMQPQGIEIGYTTPTTYWPTYNFLTWHRNSPDSVDAFLHAKMRTGWQPPGSGTEPGKAYLTYVMDWCNIQGTGSGYLKDTALVYGQWLTVAYVYDKGKMNVYHGCGVENNWINYPAVSELCGTDAVQVSLGNVPYRLVSKGYNYFKGKIDEMRIYKRALTKAEVQLFAGDCKPEVEPKIQVTATPCYTDRFAISDSTNTTVAVLRRVWHLSGDSIETPSFNYQFRQPGVYPLSLTLYTTAGVYTKDTVLHVASVGPKKFLKASATQYSVCAGSGVQPIVSGGTTYQWQPCTYLDKCTAASPVVTAPQDMDYTVIATDDGSCADTAVVHIAVIKKGSMVHLPSAFSPNGDGRNDVFGAASTDATLQFSLQVFNRWGRPVFSTKTSSQAWDGTWKGQAQPPGVYVWILQYRSGAGCGLVSSNGTVLLLR